MKKVLILILSVLFCCGTIVAQEKSDLQKRAEAVDPSKNIASARSLCGVCRQGSGSLLQGELLEGSLRLVTPC